MPNSSGFLFAFMLSVIVIMIVYFYIFSKSQEKFVHYWGLSWVFYSLGLVCLILSTNFSSLPFLELRKFFDLLNIMYLLFGAYTFMHVPIPSQWSKFTLYLALWMILSTVYSIDVSIAYHPVSLYQIILTLVLCYIIWKHWDLEKHEKVLSLLVFLIWGISKAAFSYIEADSFNMESAYLIEVLMSNTLNFCILLIYLAKMKKEFFIKEKLFRVMADNANDIIFYYQMSPFPCFSYISPSIESIMGYSPNEFYANPRLYIEITHADDQHKAINLFSSVIGDKGRGIHQQQILRWYTKEGSLIWLEFHNSVIMESSSVIAVDGVIRDITRRKKIEDSLKKSKVVMETFLSYISHELKTPMTAILGYISAIKDGTIVDDNEKKYAIDLIYAKSLTLQRLTEDLQQLSQLETKQFDFKFMQLSVADHINSLIYKYANDIKNADLKLNVDMEKINKVKHDIIADPERIETVFSNILFNAIKFTKSGGTIGINCSADEKNGFVTIGISDTGVGIPIDEQINIFQKFYRSSNYSPVNGKRGSGLGLAISKEIIDAHGGKLTVKSVQSKGSTFSFSLPIYKENQKEDSHGRRKNSNY